MWYKELLLDLKSLEFSAIKIKWKIGERITEDLYKFKRQGYGSKTLEHLAEDLKVSTSHLYHCITFYKKVKNYNSVINCSWHYIVHEILPESKREPIEKPKQQLERGSKKFLSEKLDLWKQGDLNSKQEIETDAQNKIKVYRILLAQIKELKNVDQ